MLDNIVCLSNEDIRFRELSDNNINATLIPGAGIALSKEKWVVKSSA